MNKVVVIQGHSIHHDRMFDTYGNDCIFSTWEDEFSNFTHTIKSEQPKNKGIANCNLQFYSTYKGCLLAKELGYSQVLKIRSDIVIKDWRILLDKMDLSKLNFFSWHNWDGGYYVDYLFGGPVEDVIAITEDIESDISSFPEKRLTNRVTTEVNYILPILIENDIECYSLKWKRDLTKSCAEDKLFECKKHGITLN